MMSNTQMLALAKKYLGDGGAKFRKYCGLGASDPYCCAFVTYLFHESGNSSLFYGGKKVTYCPTAIKWCNANLAMLPPYLAMAMDIIFFDWQPNGNPDHIGFVEKKDSCGAIYTIEGNTSNGKKNHVVAEKHRATSYVQGVYRPHYKPNVTLKKGHIAEDGGFGYQSIYNMQWALKMSFHDGIFGKATVKALQKKAGVAQDGAFGVKTARAVQKMCGLKGKDIDGEFGKKSTIALQKWINKQNVVVTPTVKPTTKPVTPTVKPSAPTVKTYTGDFPDLVVHSGQKIAETAKELAWAKGTAKSKYTYPKGSATSAFKKAIDKVYPKRSTWSKQCQAGASCDVGAGTVIRYSGIDTKMPRGLEEQIPHLQKSNLFKKTDLKKTSEMKAGDVGVYIGKTKGAHIWIGIGNKLIAEANHTAKYCLHIDTDNYTSSGKKTWGIYRACIQSAIGNGDRGTEVTKLQKFLNWYGNYKLVVDGDCGTKTVSAIKDFQKKQGITDDGWFGSASLAKAKKTPPCKSVATATQKTVVDVSYWQHTIDWAKASKQIYGAILRCSYTSQKSFVLSDDSTFAPNVKGATSNGVKIGAYHYSQAISVSEAKREAEYICKKLNAYKSKITLPVVIDWEFGGRLSASKAKSLGKDKCTEIVSAFCEIVTDYGYTPMVYANYNTFSNYLDYDKLKKKYLIWLAQYASKASLAYDYWQYTSSGKVNGINGKVDINKANIK